MLDSRPEAISESFGNLYQRRMQHPVNQTVIRPVRDRTLQNVGQKAEATVSVPPMFVRLQP